MSIHPINATLAKIDQSTMHLHREKVTQQWLVLQLGPGHWRSADVARERARLMSAWQLARSKGIPTRLDKRPPRPASIDYAALDAAAAAKAAEVTGEVRACAYEQCDETFEVRVQAQAQRYCGRFCNRKQTYLDRQRREQARAAAG